MEGSLLGTLTQLSQSASEGEYMLHINRLFDFPLVEVEHAIMQVAHVAVTHPSEKARDLMRKCLATFASRSLLVGLRLCWISDPHAFEACGMADEVRALQDLVEAATINLPPTKTESPDKLSRRKDARCTVFNDERLFLQQLIHISGYLRTLPDKAKRKQELVTKLNDINEVLPMRNVFFPLTSSAQAPKWVVNIVASECTVFSSRERAPFLLVLETITDSGCTCCDPVPAAGGHMPCGINDQPTKRTMTSHRLSLDLQSGDGGLLSQVFGESAGERSDRIRSSSPYGSHPKWSLEYAVVKEGDDLRQEELALQLIALFNRIWEKAGITAVVKPYAAISTANDGGIIQFVNDALSIDSVKKAAQVQSLHQFFLRAYGGVETQAYVIARRNFVESMAGYSVVCYLLQIKDRHNGNLLLSRAGHLVHIDFGFMLATSPGGINFESAPFKLSQELVDVMGGVNSSAFAYFKVLVYQAFREAQAHAEDILSVVELMAPNTSLPCFGADPQAVISQIRDRFKLPLTDIELALDIRDMISNSVDNWRTRKYDQFQTWQNGII